MGDNEEDKLALKCGETPFEREVSEAHLSSAFVSGGLRVMDVRGFGGRWDRWAQKYAEDNVENKHVHFLFPHSLSQMCRQYDTTVERLVQDRLVCSQRHESESSSISELSSGIKNILTEIPILF